MVESPRRFFAGVRVTAQLDNHLNSPAPGTERYFTKENSATENSEYLYVITLNDKKLIGRYLEDGFPAAELNDVSRNICSILRLIAPGHRLEEKSVHIYLA
jgi:hypothetical protein